MYYGGLVNKILVIIRYFCGPILHDQLPLTLEDVCRDIVQISIFVRALIFLTMRIRSAVNVT